jgi:hypothetical protein
MTTLQQLQEEIGMDWFGRSVTLAKAGNQCVSCGKIANEFRDERSRKEYNISCMCQTCQDEVFGQFVDG